MKPLLSILMPCYNSEKYLKQSLESVLNQTLKEIEVICVNDGSTDSTLKILKEYQSNDDRVKIINKENSGYGDSLNKALDIVQGEYVGIVEPDDYIKPEMFKTLYDASVKYSLDKCRCLFHDVYTDRITINKFPAVPKNIVFSPLEKKEIFFVSPSIWACIYKTSLIKDNNIRFLNTPGASYQDTSFNFKTNALAKRIMFIDKALHFYRRESGGNSVTNKAKVEFVQIEWSEIYNFVKSQNGNLDCLYPTMAMVLLNSYDWNYKRIADCFKSSFMFSWWKETVQRHVLGQTKFKELSPFYKKVEYVVLFMPFLYGRFSRNDRKKIW